MRLFGKGRVFMARIRRAQNTVSAGVEINAVVREGVNHV